MTGKVSHSPENKPADLVYLPPGSRVSQAEAEFIQARARDYKIDVVGRLEWIEDAFEMIQAARSSLK